MYKHNPSTRRGDGALVAEVRAKVEALNTALAAASEAGLYIDLREQQVQAMDMDVPHVWIELRQIARPL